MEALDRILEKATDPTSGILHGTVFIAVDRSAKIPGETIYARASGVDSVGTGAEASPKPLQLNSLYWVASMTKLVTAVAAVQLVERRILDLDMDVRKYVKELEGVSGKNSAHFLREYGISALFPDGAEQEGYTHPLLFQPGTSWGYGAGLDWAGVLGLLKIERVTGVRLSTYIEDNIFSRLDASCTSFLHPDQQPQEKTPPPLLGMAYRTTPKPRNRNSKATNSSFTTYNPVLKPMPSLQAGPIILTYPLSHDLGGIGLFSTPADFASLLASLLRDGDRLFSRGKDSTDLLLAPQLFSEYAKAGKALPAGLGRQMKRVFGVGVNARSSTVKQPVEQREWIDRESGIAAALFTQLMPPSDEKVTGLLISLEEALYAAVGNKEGSVNQTPDRGFQHRCLFTMILYPPRITTGNISTGNQAAAELG
ncbi:beta-lactamase/transpeptidase-like protein [Aspergillus tetrazonus]